MMFYCTEEHYFYANIILSQGLCNVDMDKLHVDSDSVKFHKFC